ncbi:MAG TPA: hypothetical protein VMD58_02350 [Acidobacteriaceae bacterium]|nr:hypothetical protein [Acidobacteriaceae bacterium]
MVRRQSDPFDQQLIVLALTEVTPIITPDEKFRQYREVRVSW